MKRNVAIFAGVLLSAGALARADITTVATFENFAVGQTFKPSFTDPLSGIIFSDSTSSVSGFAIASGLAEFNYGNYLNSAGYTGWTYEFGFTGTLPAPANNVTMEISTGGTENDHGVVLQGFNSDNEMVSQQSGPDNTSDPFTLQISSGQYNITYFKVVATNIFTGYDNISFTSAPEPASLLIIGVGLLGLRYRQRRS